MENKDEELEELKRRFKQNNYATINDVVVYSTIISIIVWITCFFINYQIQKLRAIDATIRVEKQMNDIKTNYPLK